MLVITAFFAVVGLAVVIYFVHHNHSKPISDDDNIKSYNLKEAAKGLGVYMGASLKEPYL